jgi:hypothetical protein
MQLLNGSIKEWALECDAKALIAALVATRRLSRPAPLPGRTVAAALLYQSPGHL